MKHRSSIIEYPTNVDNEWFLREFDKFMDNMWSKHKVAMTMTDLTLDGKHQATVDGITKNENFWDKQGKS